MKHSHFFNHYLTSVLIIIIQLTSSNTYGQVIGCTDPLALNYNAATTVNNGSCTYAVTTYQAALKIDTLNDALKETSGLQMAGGFLWTINDGGDSAVIYRIDTIKNEILQRVILEGAQNIDWEDIGFDGSYFYIGDFGNNLNGARTDLKIYKFPFGAIPNHAVNNSATIPAVLIQVINFSYSDQPQPPQPSPNNFTKFDCEAMIIDDGKIHLFTKDWVTLSTTHYVIADTAAGTYTASPVETLATNYLVTAADKATGQNIVVLLGYQNSGAANHFIHFLSEYSGEKYFNGNKRRLDLPNVLYMGQAEGVAFRNGFYGYISNEQFERQISPTQVLTVTAKLRSFAIDNFIANSGTIYHFTGNGNWDLASNWEQNMMPPTILLGGSEIIIDPVTGGKCILNIPYTVTAGCILTVKPGKELVLNKGIIMN